MSHTNNSSTVYRLRASSQITGKNSLNGFAHELTQGHILLILQAVTRQYDSAIIG